MSQSHSLSHSYLGAILSLLNVWIICLLAGTTHSREPKQQSSSCEVTVLTAEPPRCPGGRCVYAHNVHKLQTLVFESSNVSWQCANRISIHALHKCFPGFSDQVEFHIRQHSGREKENMEYRIWTKHFSLFLVCTFSRNTQWCVPAQR